MHTILVGQRRWKCVYLCAHVCAARVGSRLVASAGVARVQRGHHGLPPAPGSNTRLRGVFVRGANGGRADIMYHPTAWEARRMGKTVPVVAAAERE